jgi:hypothetical protein
VWLVRPGRPESIPGLLNLDRESLTFVSGPEGGFGEGARQDSSGREISGRADPPITENALPIPLNRIARARRRRLTPILEITYTSARADHAVVFFYFARPPPLPGNRADTGRRGPGFGLLPSKGLEQTASAMTLRAANKRLKGTIDGWVEAIRVARGAG